MSDDMRWFVLAVATLMVVGGSVLALRNDLAGEGRHHIRAVTEALVPVVGAAALTVAAWVGR